MTQSSDEWIALGIVTRPHALRGQVMLHPLARNAQDILDIPLKKARLRTGPGRFLPITITRIALHKGLPMLTIEEITDRNGAEEIRGAELVIPASERPELPDGKYYLDELEDMEVFEEETSRVLGTVKRVMEGVAHDYLVFDNPDQPGKEALLPFVQGVFILQVDRAANRITVSLPGGLLEL